MVKWRRLVWLTAFPIIVVVAYLLIVVAIGPRVVEAEIAEALRSAKTIEVDMSGIDDDGSTVKQRGSIDEPRVVAQLCAELAKAGRAVPSIGYKPYRPPVRLTLIDAEGEETTVEVTFVSVIAWK